MRVNIVCSKWGTRYGPHFVNKLKNMAKRNCNPKHDFHFYCYTDDAEGLDDDVKVIPFPDIPNIHPKYWFQKDEFKYGMARCWDRPKTMVFNTHNFAEDKPTGRFVFFDLDVIIQNDIEPLLTYNMERPTKLRSWWQDPRPMKGRRFKLSHGAYTNGSCQVWSDDQAECIWHDVLEHQEKIWFTYTDGTDNYHSWRWGDWGKKLWDHFPSDYAYSYNRGRSWEDDDLTTEIYRETPILCVFNIDLLPKQMLKGRGSVKQNELVDPELLKHWQ